MPRAGDPSAFVILPESRVFLRTWAVMAKSPTAGMIDPHQADHAAGSIEGSTGIGAASKSHEGLGTSSDGTVSRIPQQATAPWQSSSWPTDREHAVEALRNGSIPIR